jgi:two-component system, chemotaxis family, chemotaxis protein CheY
MDTSLRVLIIDDSKTMRDMQRAMLNKMGIESVEEAENGQDGLSKLGAFRPDLILCDWYMPILDGLEFVKQARFRGCCAPIIMITTESERSKVVMAIRAGVNNYIVKPFTQEVLSVRITETMARVKAPA